MGTSFRVSPAINETASPNNRPRIHWRHVNPVGDFRVRIVYFFASQHAHIYHHCATTTAVEQLVPVWIFIEIDTYSGKPEVADLLISPDNKIVSEYDLCGDISSKEQSQECQD